ncbi:MAG: DUF5384 family protein [Acidiferrobacterales bacterium]
MDKLRALKIGPERLKFQAEKVRAARESDFISAQLKKQNAEAGRDAITS